MKRYSNPRQVVIFLLIAMPLLIIVKLGLWKLETYQKQSETPLYSPVDHSSYVIDVPERSEIKNLESALKVIDQKEIPEESAKKVQNEVKEPLPNAKPYVVIIIDDLGMDQRRSAEIVDLKAPLTLAFLPYAPGVKKMAKHAKKQGHELLIHTPMEPLNTKLDAGPAALYTDMSARAVNEQLDKILESFAGYVGINNHMGSKATQDQNLMNAVMMRLHKEGLIFVDSKTIHTSVAGGTAEKMGVPYAIRDVFLDHEESLEFVENSLAKLERIAKKTGTAIAIGHPKDVTIQALRKWIPTLEKKGLQLAPVSWVVHAPEDRELSATDYSARALQ